MLYYYGRNAMTKNSEKGRLAESVRLVKARSRYLFSGIPSEQAHEPPVNRNEDGPVDAHVGPR